jgi:hypothetical protein
LFGRISSFSMILPYFIVTWNNCPITFGEISNLKCKLDWRQAGAWDYVKTPGNFHIIL